MFSRKLKLTSRLYYNVINIFGRFFKKRVLKKALGCVTLVPIFHEPIMLYYQIAIPSFMKALVTYTTTDKDASQYLGFRSSSFWIQRKSWGDCSCIAKTDLDQDKIKPIIRILDHKPVFQASELDFLNRLARYYHLSLNELILLAIPKPLLSLEHSLDDIYLKASSKPNGALSSAMQRVHQACQEPQAQIKLMHRFSKSTIQALIDKQLLIHSTAPSNNSIQPVANLASLNDSQLIALNNIRDNMHKPCLLWGATGSGKTEVYCHLIYDVIQQNKQVLLLVPEIALTPQVVQKIHDRLNIEPIVIHSHLSPNKRLNHWLQAKHQHAQIIIGTRSALLTPIPNLGLIVIDEEHDDSYRHDCPLFYSARELLF